MQPISYYWNDCQEYHPKNRLLKYSKCSKISKDILRILAQLRTNYLQLPAIVYSLRNEDENASRTRENNGKQCKS
jgi:hypothetical protein